MLVDKANTGQPKLLFTVFLMLGFGELFIKCSEDHEVEMFTYSVEDIKFEMEIFNVIDGMFDDCRKMKKPVNDQVPLRRRSYMEISSDVLSAILPRLMKSKSEDNLGEKDEDRVKKPYFHYLKPEIMCMQKKGQHIKIKNILQITAAWWIQFLTAKYSYIFTLGHLHFKERADDKLAARSCAVLAAYLATFATDIRTRKLFAKNFFKHFWFLEQSQKSSIPFNWYTFKKFLDGLSKSVLENYHPETQTINIETIEQFDEVMLGKSPAKLHKDFHEMMFGERKSMKKHNSFVSDENLWESSVVLVDIIKSDDSTLFVNRPNSNSDLIVDEASTANPIISSSNSDNNQSRLIELLREIEMLKIKPQLEELANNGHTTKEHIRIVMSMYKTIKSGFTDGSALDLGVVKMEDGELTVRFLKRKASLSDNTELNFLKQTSDGVNIFEIPTV